jgi:RNA polymerase primary sigma factor
MEENINSLKEYFKEITKIVGQIDRTKETELWKKAQKGNKKAENDLLKMHLRLVVPIAKRYLKKGIELMDLIEEGNLGLLQAIKRFDPKRGFRFSTYAVHWIEQYIKRWVDEQVSTIKLPPHAWDNLRTWLKTWDTLKVKLGREPSLKEMSVKLNLSERQVRSILDSMSAAYGVDSLSITINDDEDSSLENVIPDEPTSNPDTKIMLQSTNALMLSILNELSQRERDILIMRFGVDRQEPYTLLEVATKLGVSRERVRQIEERAIAKVRKRAKDFGIWEPQKHTSATINIHTGLKGKEEKNLLGDIKETKLEKTIRKDLKNDKRRNR